MSQAENVLITQIDPGKKIYFDRFKPDMPVEHCWIEFVEEPVIAFNQGLDMLVSPVIELGFLAQEWHDSSVSCIKFKHSEDVFSAAISLNLVVPMQPLQGFTLRQLASDALESNELLCTQLETLLNHAEDYVLGKRGFEQLGLFDKEDKEVDEE